MGLTLHQKSGVKCAEVANVACHDGSSITNRLCQNELVGDSPQPDLCDGNDIMSPTPQLIRDRGRELLVQEKPHSLLEIACWRRNAASASSIIRWFISIQPSISSRLSA